MSVSLEEFAQAKSFVSQAMGLLENVFCDLYLKYRLNECSPAESTLAQELEAFYSSGESVIASIEAVSKTPPVDDVPPWDDEE